MIAFARRSVSRVSAWLMHSEMPRAEAMAFALGILVRVLVAIGFQPHWGFDVGAHMQNARWVAEHWSPPDLSLNAAAYHSPLYYYLAAVMLRLGAGIRGVQMISIVSGCVRLGIIWIGLRRFLPGLPMARVLALVLAAVLPAAVQLDGHVTNEALGTTIAAACVLLLPAVARREPLPRDVVLFFLVLGLAVLTKISYLAIGFLVVPYALRHLWRERSRLLVVVRPYLLGAAVFAVVTAPVFVLNMIRYGKPSVTAYDGVLKPWHDKRALTPYLDRRTLGFYVGWDTDIWDDPYWPTSCCTKSRYFPVLVANTFGDYLNYLYGMPARAGEESVMRNNRRLTLASFKLSRASTAAGTLLAIVLVAGVLGIGRRLWGKGDPRLALVLLPVVGVLGQMHFATNFPADTDGPVKGTYIQFAMLPAFGIVGVVFEALLRRRRNWSRAFAAMIAAAVVVVAAYTMTVKLGTAIRGPAAGPPPPPESALQAPK
jgi:hypothetical protein